MADNDFLAGWNPDWGEAPFTHGTPPEIDSEYETNGIGRKATLPLPIPRHLGGYVSWPDVEKELRAVVGFREGPNNQNPWGPEQGVKNASYCCSGSCMVPYHHGYRYWPESQFGEKGDAYVPYHVKHAQAHGEWQFDHTAGGKPCDLVPGDKSVFVWPGGDGAGDHIETVVAVYPDGTFLTVGFNTGRPEGCYLVHRDRKYLLGRIRPSMYSNPNPAPIPVGVKVMPPYPFHTTMPEFVDWPEVTIDGRTYSWILTPDGAMYASPGSPGVPGVNGQDYWVAPTHHAGAHSASKAHVRQENGRFVSCIEDTEGFLFRPDRAGPDFRTH